MRLPRLRALVPSRGEALAALASGGLFAVAFPPFDMLVPALVCLVPVAVYVARRADAGGHAWEAARTGFWFAVIGYGANLYWIAVALSLYTNLAILGYAGALIWLGPIIGATLAMLLVARRLTGWPLAILLPLVWVASEVVLNYTSDLSFPWLPLGLATARIPLLAQSADLSGVRGVSLWIAAANGAIADAWLWRFDRRAALRRAALVPVLLAAAVSYGAWRMRTITLRPLARIAVIQPNIPEEAKLTIQDPTSHVARLTEMTRELLARSEPAPALVVWPEAALDRFLWQFPAWADSLRSAVAGHPTPILTGFLDSSAPWERPFEYWNAALITDPWGRIGAYPPYHKQFLVPVVERVPFLEPSWFRGLNYFGGFARGSRDTPYVLPFASAGILICYEAIFPQLSLAYARHGATVLLNITNDAWFQRSNAPYQHFAHLPLRAIETRLPVVRAANTGISAYVDPIGRVHGATPLFEPRAVVYDVQQASVRSLYVAIGDWAGTLSLVATAALLAAAVWTAARERRLRGPASHS